MNFKETDLGFELQTKDYFVFFGKKDSSIENLEKSYPQFSFKMLHQVHGNDILYTTANSENSLKADAHWTDEKGIALISKSADCVPLLAYDSENKRILAIHAGWRGVQNRIVPKSLEQLGSNWEIYIGPHITAQSFEIKDDCLNLLKLCTNLNQNDWYQNGKADLYKILKEQVKGSSIKPFIFDTVTDLRFHSFRRDRDAAGRQNNFIVLT